MNYGANLMSQGYNTTTGTGQLMTPNYLSSTQPLKDHNLQIEYSNSANETQNELNLPIGLSSGNISKNHQKPLNKRIQAIHPVQHQGMSQSKSVVKAQKPAKISSKFIVMGSDGNKMVAHGQSNQSQNNNQILKIQKQISNQKKRSVQQNQGIQNLDGRIYQMMNQADSQNIQ